MPLQGIGAGGIQSMTAVVISDLVPLSKRGAYQGLVSAGNALIMGSTVATVIALTWGGTTHPWSSYQVMVPLILGLVGLVVFFIYEAKFAEEPVVPWALGTKGQRPVASGVSVFGNVFTIAPMGIVSGISVLFTGWYKPQTVFAWVLVAVGVGLLSLLDRETSKAEWVGFQIIEGVGLGLLYPITSFPVLAPIPVTQSGYALALWTFVRSYGQMWGITIGAAVLQNGLKKRLPQDFLSLFPKQNIEIAYAVIPMIDGLEESRRIEVQDAFAGSIRVIWLVLVGIAGVGFLSSLVMKQLKLHTAKDEDWGMKEKSGDPEKVPEA
ncbi:hypothetical protein FRC05_003564 [Tulasnella sp. 425]|nr:hypothetical protein FRC05_003564 [Tulasnella sp. 425]